MTDIKLEALAKNFGPAQIIRGVDLDIKAREFMVFVGPSGCGKSTLLRLIAGLEDISSGRLWMGGRLVNDLPPAERGIAMVFQSYALYPHMSVYENMAFGLTLARRDRATIEARVREAARILKIEKLLDRKPKQLSGGQRQRVAIGRAIVRDPAVFLFDEPLSNLDAALRVEMRVEIAKLHRALNATMIYVTHDQHEAMTLAERIVVLDSGQIRQIGAPLELYHHPCDRFVAGFIGSPQMNFLPCSLLEGRGREAQLRLFNGAQFRLPIDAAGAATGEGYSIGIRPEHMQEGGGDGNNDNSNGAAMLEGAIVTIERLGAEAFVYLDVGAEKLVVAKAASTISAQPGERRRFKLSLDSCHLFDKNGRALRRQGAAAKPVVGV